LSRTLEAPMVSHLATRSHTRCNMLLLELADGTTIAVTDHDVNLDFDIGDGVETYRADTGFQISDIQIPIGLEPGNFEVSGPITEDGPVTRAALLGGRFNRAEARLFAVNWNSLTSGPVRILKGKASNIRPEGGKFVFEVRDARDAFSQTILNVITNQCRADHESCCVHIADETATTVTAVTDALTIEVAAALTADDFTNGKLWFTTGVLAGTSPIEIHDVTGSTVTLFTEVPALPSIGDAVTLKEGCDRSRTMCRDRFDNVVNFRGYPDVSGSDQILRMPIPGQGSE
jgi:uncharacterized phage protein (TIGR02218 family)